MIYALLVFLIALAVLFFILFDRFKKEDMPLVYSRLDDGVLEKIIKRTEKLV